MEEGKQEAREGTAGAERANSTLDHRSHTEPCTHPMAALEWNSVVMFVLSLPRYPWMQRDKGDSSRGKEGLVSRSANLGFTEPQLYWLFVWNS